jgi:hypothetical protein
LLLEEGGAGDGRVIVIAQITSAPTFHQVNEATRLKRPLRGLDIFFSTYGVKLMDLKNVRHLREILVTDARGKTTKTMQYSSQNASHFRPNFSEVPSEDQARARELYLSWGGQRREGK